ncbi:MAG TPA: 50S ribosomal protein L11 methyltransferase [Acidimicrobiales bacterium]|nr:50S ribosomal protein L11 methyltransferase [Acidimicrobiales bacterium]
MTPTGAVTPTGGVTPTGRAHAVRVVVPPGEAELAADALWQAGAAAIEERPGELVAATADVDPAPLLAAVAGRWPAVVEAVDLDAALDAWREHARPVVVGRRLIVHPPWAPPDDGAAAGRRRVVIDPGRAFGHGAHPSTRLVLAALDDLVRGGERVLDLGCGSGVLAIAALALGAAAAVGIDVDPGALAATVDNARRTGVADRLTVVEGDAVCGDDAGGAGYDLVVANMLLPQLVELAPVVARALAPGGTAVVSGVLDDQRDQVAAAYHSAGLAPLAFAGEGGWLSLTLRAG